LSDAQKTIIKYSKVSCLINCNIERISMHDDEIKSSSQQSLAK